MPKRTAFSALAAAARAKGCAISGRSLLYALQLPVQVHVQRNWKTIATLDAGGMGESLFYLHLFGAFLHSSPSLMFLLVIPSEGVTRYGWASFIDVSVKGREGEKCTAIVQVRMEAGPQMKAKV